eukprot:8045913-Prorocentrum_lima.AAC.1
MPCSFFASIFRCMTYFCESCWCKNSSAIPQNHGSSGCEASGQRMMPCRSHASTIVNDACVSAIQ